MTSFTINNLNFNPSIITNSDSTFINYKYSQSSYQFTQNEKAIQINSSNTHIIVSFYFWLQNYVSNYERNYERFQDLLSNIGGINSFVLIISSIINSFMINYRILLDTEESVLKIDKYNFNKTKVCQKPTILKKASEIFNPPKLKINKNNNNINNNTNNNMNNKHQSSVFQMFLQDNSDIFKSIIKKKIDSKSENLNNAYFKKSQEINLSKKKTSKNINNNIIISKKFENFHEIDNSDKNDIDSKSMSFNINNKESMIKIEAKNKNEECKPIIKQNFSWYSYIFYKFTCKLTNPKIRYYETFRNEVISEENIIQNHINIFKLLNFCKLENLDPFCIKNYNICCNKKK